MAYRKGQFSVVEGLVSNFRPMPYEGHQEECFSVQSQTFCYSDYAVTGGFNNATSHGGLIREGLPVRVLYIGGAIVRLEVRGDALPSAAERTESAKAARKNWQQREEKDLVLDRMTLGFAAAAVIDGRTLQTLLCGEFDRSRFVSGWTGESAPEVDLSISCCR